MSSSTGGRLRSCPAQRTCGPARSLRRRGGLEAAIGARPDGPRRSSFRGSSPGVLQNLHQARDMSEGAGLLRP
eukprot:CAMPEP_0175783438 /NCGR_PEP_ID=MMETSP0097-20121207/78303_1 /TAXON_ID=311494 /ORGANISM="Alexandrium monilatum, Strain CCMP3105" /LENGTH=72 /DNA_ID=CAMNT_0017094299 /DNA_START=131 /DNA_END=349 /DNA_ORIENTATION=-